MARSKAAGAKPKPASRRRKRPYTVSDRVRAANKLNAQRARGKKSPEGLKVSSMNALQHARYAQTAVLPGECPIAHQERIDESIELLGSESGLERRLATYAAQASWNLDRSQKANRDVLHGRMFRAQRKARRDRVAAQMFLQAYLDAGCPAEAAPGPLGDETR